MYYCALAHYRNNHLKFSTVPNFKYEALGLRAPSWLNKSNKQTLVSNHACMHAPTRTHVYITNTDLLEEKMYL